MFWTISEGVRLLAKQMIDRPDEWVQEQYYFRNKKHPDIAIWTANGTSHINFSGNKCLTSGERAHLASAIKKSIAMKLLMRPEVEKISVA